MEKIIVIVIIKIYVIAIIIYCYAMIISPKNHYVFKLKNRRINLGLRVTMVHFTVKIANVKRITVFILVAIQAVPPQIIKKTI